ncbi:hypothetical protein FB451DRAFT_1182728 [Mycena latifolia]|nr:hypothetical protein FB451DRAFT_1182728 [Mycena latifolia]
MPFPLFVPSVAPTEPPRTCQSDFDTRVTELGPAADDLGARNPRGTPPCQDVEGHALEDLVRNLEQHTINFDCISQIELHHQVLTHQGKKAYIHSGAGQVSAATVPSWVFALQLWHQFNGAPWHGDNIRCRTKKGVSKLALASSRRPLRDPVSFNYMLMYSVADFDLSNTLDSAVWAAGNGDGTSPQQADDLTTPIPRLRGALKPLQDIQDSQGLRSRGKAHLSLDDLGEILFSR